VLGYDPVQRYVEAIEEHDSAWGAFPTVTFRFSNMLDVDSLKQDGVVNFVDITPSASDRDWRWGWRWTYDGNRSAYVCESRLIVQRPLGAPLVAGNVYAVYVTTEVLDADGEPVTRSGNLSSVLGDDAPADQRLAAVHEAYAPLRDYLAEEDIDPDTILTATVITAGRVRDTMAELADLVGAQPAPTASEWTLCGEEATSPCPQHAAEHARACGTGNAAFDEYHALVALPVFQEGEAPYLTSGGGIVVDAPQRSEQVCLALTVPTGEMPGAGWPLVVFAHGTGGSFRSHVRDEVAGVLAEASIPGADGVGFAVLGIDQVQHGPRRGSSEVSPDQLFFNFGNPAAARGNALQGAADQLGLARFAAELDVTVESTNIRVDPDRVYFFGHSQGATHGSLALPYSTTYGASVLSGNGAGLAESLVSKQSPVNIPALLPVLLADPNLGTDQARLHPVLGLLQQWMDVADPLSFAQQVSNVPDDPPLVRSVFATYGLGDTYSPPRTLAGFVLAGQLALVDNSGVDQDDPVSELTPVEAPLAGNSNGATVGFRQYEPAEDSDGHFVVFDVARANEDMVRFFATAAGGETPTIGN
jgi:hypothetical protein